MTGPDALDVAMQHHQAGNLAQAEQLCRRILAGNPGDANALHLLGMLAQQQGQNQRAVELIAKAVALLPHVAEFHSNLAGAYLGVGRPREAATHCEQALSLRPDLPEAHATLGKALALQGNLPEAAVCYRRAAALRPEFYEVHKELGHLLKQMGQLAEAQASYQEALRLRPDDADAYNNLGVVLADQRRFDEADVLYREALRLWPDFADAQFNLGLTFAARGRRDEAISAYQQTVRIKPDYAQALNNLANFYKDQGRIEEALAGYRQALAARPGDPVIQGNLLFVRYFPADYDPEGSFAEHLRWGKQLAGSISATAPCLAFEPGRRLRIGYVSPDFRESVMGRFVERVIAAHERAQVEVFCYANVAQEDRRTERIRASADHWRSILGMSDPDAADLIRQDRVDLLVDLAGHTGNNRLPVFAHRPAPIQVTHFGYPASTGLPTIDYRLTDCYHDPPGLTEHLHCETLVRLPRILWCFVPWESPEINPLPARRSGEVTFGSINKLAKITEPVMELWTRILRALPGSRLLMVSGAGQAGDERVRRVFAREGIGSERVLLVGRQSLEEYLGLIQRMDILLDSYPFTGCNTTADALWLGVPIVTLAGPTWVTRQGLAILNQVGLEDLIADTPEAYVEIAVRLAQDLPRLRELRQELRERLSRSPLMDVPGFTRDLEAAYRELCERWQPLQKP